MIHEIKYFSELTKFKSYEEIKFIDLKEGDFKGLKEKLSFVNYDHKDQCVHLFPHKCKGGIACYGISCVIWGGNLNYSWQLESGYYSVYRRGGGLLAEYTIKIERRKPLLVSPDGNLERWIDYDKWLELRAFM